MKDNIVTIVFSIVLGAVCAFLLTGARIAFGPLQQANKLAEERRNVLTVVGVTLDEKITNQEINRLFEEKVKVSGGETPDALKLYSYIPDASSNQVAAVAVPFAGQGLWDKIKGYLALEPDMKTIKGLTVYEQAETPGLGDDITKPPFQKQFPGKSIYAADGKPGFYIRKPGMAKSDNEVDGISGATITGDKLQIMLNQMIERIAAQKK